MLHQSPPEVLHDEARSRFVIEIDAHLAHADDQLTATVSSLRIHSSRPNSADEA